MRHLNVFLKPKSKFNSNLDYIYICKYRLHFYMKTFSAFYYSIRTNYALTIFVWLTRYLLAFAFIPSGMKKLLGERFTSIGIDNPIGFFFEALYRSGMYWNFLGWSQVITALLMMTQRFSTIGNLIYFFIISNICCITIAMQFTGTWVITSLMLLASVCLLLWDANKFQYIFTSSGFFKNNHEVKLPEASRFWEISGLLLFILSVAYPLIDRVITEGHLVLFFIIFIAILIVVIATLFMELKNKKANTRN